MKALLIVEYDDEFDIDDLMVDYTLFHKEKNVYRMFNDTLKPMPKIKDLRDYRDKIVGDYKLQIRLSDFINGYNSCIGDLLGEEK